MPPSSPAATVLIATKNRKDELRKAIQSALDQDVNVEVVVIDDGSTDNTTDMVRSEFGSAVQSFRFEESGGATKARNHGARLARAPILFTLDDDAVFTTCDSVRRGLADFDHPRVGVVAFQILDINGQLDRIPLPPDPNNVWLFRYFIAAGGAMRRDLFLKLGGFCEEFFYLVEEPEYCLRVMGAGYVTRVSRSAPVLHRYSPTRNFPGRARYMVARNNLLSCWYNAPFPYLPVHAAALSVREMQTGLRDGGLWWTLRGITRGNFNGLRRLPRRHAMPLNAYRLNLLLRKRGTVRLDEVEHMLPPPIELG